MIGLLALALVLVLAAGGGDLIATSRVWRRGGG